MPDLPAVTVIRVSAQNALADLRMVYTWKSWTFGWLGRMLAQVIFFSLLGEALGQPSTTRYLVVGNALMTCVVESMLVVASTTWERVAGTLPLLVAAPVRLGWVFVGRSLQWPVSGTATSSVSLLVLGPAFGVSWSLVAVPAVVGLVLLTAFATYSLGLFLGALVLQASNLRNIVSNASYFGMMAICGVAVPVGYWPAPVRWLAQVVPLTHSLAALRTVAAGGSPAAAARQSALAAVIGVAWLAAALAAFGAVAQHGRRAGTIDFAA
jgi:ABC-2 type transport system permease protein